MVLSQKGREILKRFEGFRGCPYLDSVKVPTIGIGTTFYPDGTLVTMKDSCIDVNKAYEYLDSHVVKYVIKEIEKYITSSINQNQTDAIISFVYNVGAGAFRKSTLLKKINTNPGDKTSITTEFMKWNKAGGKPLAGLTARRKEEVKLYFS